MCGDILCYRRFLRKGLFRTLAPTRLSPQEGLAVFNRFAHSAGPGSFMQRCQGVMVHWHDGAIAQRYKGATVVYVDWSSPGLHHSTMKCNAGELHGSTHVQTFECGNDTCSDCRKA